MARRNGVRLSKHFELWEFESPDTGEVIVFPELVERLEKLRELVGGPVLVLSAYRTPEHNRGVGGAPDSYHLRGMAADVTWDGFELERAARWAELAGFDGIGRYPRKGSLHVDVRGYLARWTKGA